jgi:putative flippase GtrA
MTEGRLDALLSGVRFGQFASVGALGAVCDTSLVVLLTTYGGFYRGSAKLVGAEVAIIVMFLVNEHWTFSAEGEAGRWSFLRRFLKSNLVRAGGVLVATVVFVLVSGLDYRFPVGGEGLWLVFSNGVGIAVGMFVNYVAESLFTWRVGRS